MEIPQNLTQRLSSWLIKSALLFVAQIYCIFSKTPKTSSNIPVAQHLQSGNNYKILNTRGLLELSAKDAPLINCSDPSNGSKDEKFTN